MSTRQIGTADRVLTPALVLDVDSLRLPCGLVAHYRPGTSDESVLREVITKAAYRRKRIGFDVRRGEHWLDLGANIGAFALYCQLQGANADCYEPDEGCFDMLSRNVPNFERHRHAVTNRHEERLPFWKGRSPTDFYRATAIPSRTLPQHPSGTLPNRHGGFLLSRTYDGIKIDIEGSEGGLLDDGLIPECRKLCLEYHLSRDPSMENLSRRLDYLKSRFRVVSYPPELDRLVAAGGTAKTFFDRMVFCCHPRKDWRLDEAA